MNNNLKSLIYALVVTIICFVIAFITFVVGGGWFGLIPLGIALFFLIKYTIPLIKQQNEETDNNSSVYVFTNKCEILIDDYEKNDLAGFISCKPLILKIIKEHKSELKPDITDIDSNCNFFLLNQSSKLLASGVCHISFGDLNEQGKSLLKVFDHSSKWLFENGLITQEQYKTACRKLNEDIRTVG